ncbi:MAG: glycosyltransferase family 2 protein [Gemmatimonadota bacterium]
MTGGSASSAADRYQVTIAMPARNAVRWIGDALQSVLSEPSLDLDVCVVDDASDDGTADAASSLGDPRVRLIRSPQRRGIAWCHNQVLHSSTSPVLVHVDADDIVVPGAIARVVARLLDCPSAAQAYCDFVPADAGGRAADLERWRRFFQSARAPAADVRRQLILHGMVVNHLRTYRRSALLSIGGFDESLDWGVDYDAAIRLAERWEFVRVPEILYIKRILPTGASESLRFSALRFWRLRWRLVRRALEANGGTLFGMSSARVHALLVAGLADAAGLGVFVPGAARLPRWS